MYIKVIIICLALALCNGVTNFQHSSSVTFFNVHKKPHELQHLLAAPLQLAISMKHSGTDIKILSIDRTAVKVNDDNIITISATVTLTSKSICVIHTDMDLRDISMDNTDVECNASKMSLANELSELTFSEENTELYHHADVKDHFEEFWRKYQPNPLAIALDGGEYNKFNRYQIFVSNMIRAAWMNALERGSATYGHTSFSDLTHTEFSNSRGLDLSSKRTLRTINYQSPQPDSDAPNAYDWRDFGAVTKVKNQGQCGSCWSFSTTGNIEGVHAVATGELLSLSEQELVDCDKTDQGCQGGLMDNAFEQVMELGGLELEDDYKYEGRNGKCRLDKTKIAVDITGFHDIPQGDEVAMRTQLLKTGPLAVALNAMWMQFYTGGVSHPWAKLCSPKALDHGVLIVGYGVEPAKPDHLPFPKKEQPYWIIKNSWGPGWGEKGYYRLYRGDGTCGIDQYATTALV